VKNCSKCNEQKEFCDFHRDSHKKDGHKTICKKCTLLYRKSYVEINKNSIENYYICNKEKIKSYRREYYKENKQKEQLSSKEYYSKNKQLHNARCAARRARKLKATPPWLSKEQIIEIREFYEISLAFRIYTGQEYHVDHIIPLKGKDVCGLHVPWNLQIIPAKENLSKSNRLIEEL